MYPLLWREMRSQKNGKAEDTVVPPLLTCTPDPSRDTPCHQGQVSISYLALIPLTLVPTNPMQPGHTSHLDHTKAEATAKHLFGIRMVSKAICYQQPVRSSSPRQHDSFFSCGRDWWSVPLPSKASLAKLPCSGQAINVSLKTERC